MSLPTAAVIEVRTTGSDTQCGGGFNAARGGTDYTQQNAAQATGTVTSTTTTVTATTGIFTAAMVGNYITDGTTYKEITAFTNATTVTVDSAPSWTAATVYVGGALASPGKAGAVHVAGNTIYVKAGTYTVTSASTNVASGCVSLTAGAAANQTRLIGYQTTRGDNGTKPLLQASGIATFTLVAVGAAGRVDNISADGASLTASRGFQVATGGNSALAIRCKAANCTNSGFAGGTTAFVALCETTGCSSVASFNSGLSYVGCVARANSVSGFTSPASAVGCLAINNTGASTIGFTAIQGGSVQNCTAYGNGSHGFSFTGSTNGAIATNCLSASNGGFGFTVGSAYDNGLLVNCATYNNTSGAVSTNVTAASQIGLITLTGDPFTNAAGLDFSLNNTAGAGAAVRAAGIPTATGTYALPGGLSTPTYPDVGAARHPDPAPDYPTAANVRFGVSYSFGTLTGTVVLPDPTDVASGVQYGAGGTEFTGSFPGADYPGVGDVRAGVVYDFGGMVGTYDPFAPAASRGLDLSNDWKLIDSPVTVSYSVKTSEGVFAAPVSVPYCQRNAITKADLKQHPALLEKDASVFHLWTAKLGAVVPKLGDKLTHDTKVWLVVEVGMCDRDANGVQRYRCVVQKSRA